VPCSREIVEHQRMLLFNTWITYTLNQRLLSVCLMNALADSMKTMPLSLKIIMMLKLLLFMTNSIILVQLVSIPQKDVSKIYHNQKWHCSQQSDSFKNYYPAHYGALILHTIFFTAFKTSTTANPKDSATQN